MNNLNGGMAGPRRPFFMGGWPNGQTPPGPHCGSRSSLGAAFSVMPTAELLSGNHPSAQEQGCPKRDGVPREKERTLKLEPETWVVLACPSPDHFPRGFRVLAYQSPGLPHNSHTRLQSVPYTAAAAMSLTPLPEGALVAPL